MGATGKPVKPASSAACGRGTGRTGLPPCAASHIVSAGPANPPGRTARPCPPLSARRLPLAERCPVARFRLAAFAVLPLLTLSQLPGQAPDKGAKPHEPFSAATFGGLKLRAIGPAVTSGRVIALAVDPKNSSHYYVAVASGGVWKTTNAGTTWAPVFDNEGSYSIGAVAIDPKNPL